MFCDKRRGWRNICEKRTKTKRKSYWRKSDEKWIFPSYYCSLKFWTTVLGFIFIQFFQRIWNQGKNCIYLHPYPKIINIVEVNAHRYTYCRVNFLKTFWTQNRKIWLNNIIWHLLVGKAIQSLKSLYPNAHRLS